MQSEGRHMRRFIGFMVVVAAAALVVVTTAVATSGNKTQLYSKDNGPHGTAYKCFPDTPGTPTNGWTFVHSYDTQADCEAAIPTGGEVGPWTATACDGAVVIVSDVSQADADAQAAAFDCSAGGPPAVAPNPPNNIFLCYSTDQVTPSVWPIGQAAALLAGGGYWQPYAVKGNVAGGTNVGDYHLVCNIATGQAVGNQFVDDGGGASNASDHSVFAGVLGQYPLASG
jgi:hypothetical protein